MGSLFRANFLQLDDVWVTEELQDLNFALQLRHHVGLLHFLPVQDQSFPVIFDNYFGADAAAVCPPAARLVEACPALSPEARAG